MIQKFNEDLSAIEESMIKKGTFCIIIYCKCFRSFDGLRAKVKSSYPLGSCPNLGLKTNIRHYDSFRRILKQDMTLRYDLCGF